MSVGLEKGAVRIVAYDPRWPELFQQEKVALAKLFDGRIPAKIEHIGSTSVKGLPAKPIIDIAIGFLTARQVSMGMQLLLDAGREYIKGANQPGMLFVVHGEPVRQFHYHLVVRGTPAWRTVLTFRDYLRRHPGVANEYGAFKSRLAERFSEQRLEYTRHKKPLMRAIMLRAYGDDRRRRHAAAIRLRRTVEEYEGSV